MSLLALRNSKLGGRVWLLVSWCVIADLGVRAASCHSVTDGAFGNPLVWDCQCVPASCDTLVISHAVTSGESILLVGSFLLVEATGSLEVQGRLRMDLSSCEILSSGSLDAGAIEMHLEENLVNHGFMGADSVLLFEGDLTNYGILQATAFFGDAFFPAAYWVRNFGQMDLGDIYSGRPWRNDGELIAERANFGWFHAQAGSAQFSSVFVQVFMEVLAPGSVFVHDTLRIVQSFDDYGFVQCGHFLNGWSIGTAQAQVFGGGVLQCGTFTNDEGHFISGPGAICISDHSENHGVINAPITICDITLDVAVPPYLDVNTGSFQQPISYCSNASCLTLDVPENQGLRVMAYPIPAVDEVAVDIRGTGVADLEVVDVTGEVVRRVEGPFSHKLVLKRAGLASGVYLVRMHMVADGVVRTTRILFVDN